MNKAAAAAAAQGLAQGRALIDLLFLPAASCSFPRELPSTIWKCLSDQANRHAAPSAGSSACTLPGRAQLAHRGLIKSVGCAGLPLNLLRHQSSTAQAAKTAPKQHVYTQGVHAHTLGQSDIMSNSALGPQALPAALAAVGMPAQPALSQQGPAALYWRGREAGLYRPDPRQELTVQMLQELYDALAVTAAKHPTKPRSHPPSGLTMARGGFWEGISNLIVGGHRSSHGAGRHHKAHAHVKGLYMYGGVGVGKTMLMDVFVASSPPDYKVLRTHFHDFMLDVHMKLRKYKGDTDPLLRVADSIAKSAHVLALDEFFVTDVADAMILNRLFGRLWDRSLVLVATSNRPPDKLYEGGLQRNLFMPFIHRLKAECKTHDMASTTDYRKLASTQKGLYFTDPLTREQDLQEEFEDSAEFVPSAPCSVEVQMGRSIQVPRAAGEDQHAAAHAFPCRDQYPLPLLMVMTPHAAALLAVSMSAMPCIMVGMMTADVLHRSATGVGDIEDMREVEVWPWGVAQRPPARPLTTASERNAASAAAGPVDLCGRPVAAADYIALAKRFHTLAVAGLPLITAQQRSQAYRFVTLIDIMYEHKCCSPLKLLRSSCSPTSLHRQAEAAANPALKEQPDIVVDDNLGFAKDRTISRMTEMQSLEYLVAHAKHHAPQNLLALQEAQAKAAASANSQEHPAPAV
ncbi:uncharacterized protein HaLaN_04412, partial [Haematococcus lacustris]